MLRQNKSGATHVARRGRFRRALAVGLAVCAALAAGVQSCGGEPEVIAPPSPRKAKRAPMESAPIPISVVHDAGDASFFPGRVRKLPPWGDEYRRRVDPQADGWASEVEAQWIEREVARALSGALARGASEAPFLALCGAEFEGATLLQPAELEQVFTDGVVEVDRAAKLDATLHPRERLGELFDAWRASFSGAEIVRVDVHARSVRELPEARTSVLLELRVTARAGAATVQQSAHWDTRWSPAADDRWQLHGVRVEWLETVRARERVLSELTAAVLAENACYAGEIRRGNEDYHLHHDRLTGQTQLFLGMHGLAVGDVNGDGLEDLYVPQPGGQPNLLLLHQPDGTLRDGGKEAGVDFLDNSSSALLVDFDNDGDQDLAVAAAQHVLIGWNDGTGRFAAGQVLSAPDAPEIFSMSAADPDEDGDLDLYACRYVEGGVTGGAPRPYHNAKNGASNVYWRNEGERRFVNATEEAGLDANNTSFTLASIFEDYDEDGDVDLYVINDFGRKILYRNDGGRFTEVTEHAGAFDQAAGMGVDCADVDLDGDVDIYVTNMDSPAGSRIAEQARFMPANPELRDAYIYHARGNTLLLNRGDGTYEDATERAGVARAGWAWGSKFFDVNNDGLPEIYVPNGFTTNQRSPDLDSFFWRCVVAQSPPNGLTTPPDYLNAWDTIRHLTLYEGFSWNGNERNFTYLNLGGVRFADASSALGVDYIDDCRSAATADWDDDGRIDLWLRNRTGPRLRFLRNTHSAAQSFLTVDLVGTRCNRDAIGARVRVRAGDRRFVQTVYAGQGFLCASSRRLSFGLGSADRVDELEIRWPDGSREKFADLAANQRYRFVQGEAAPAIVARRGEAQLDHAPAETIEPEPRPANRIVLFDRLPLDSVELTAADGAKRKIGSFHGQLVLVSVWSGKDPASRETIAAIAKHADAFSEQGVQLVALTTAEGSVVAEDYSALKTWGWRGAAGTVDARLSQILQVVLIEVLGPFERLEMPVQFLFDRGGQLTVVYSGAADVREIAADAARVRALDPRSRSTEDLLGGRWVSRPKRAFDGLSEIFGMLGENELAQFFKVEAAPRAGR